MLTVEEILEFNCEFGKKPIFLMVRLLKKCTAKCKMCNFWKSNEEMGWKRLERIINQSSNAGVREICFTGGEPTAYSNFFQAIRKIKQEGMNYSFITNGSLLSKERIKKMMLYPPARIVISIDSPSPKIHDDIRGIKGIWNKAMGGIKELNKFSKRPKIIINYIVSSKTFKQIPRMISLSKGCFDEINLMHIKGMLDWKVSRKQIYYYNQVVVPEIIRSIEKNNVKIRSNTAFIFGREKSEIQLSAAGNYSTVVNGQNPCLLSKIMLFIEIDGEVFPCNDSPYYGKEYSLGNVFKQSLKEVFESERAQKVRDLIDCGRECKTCDPVNQETNRKLSMLPEMAYLLKDGEK